jgi:hypothetical protein
VYYSAYVPVTENSLLPSPDTKPPLLREHRLYQADFLMRQYQFAASEILSEETPNFNPYLDPKCNWAIHHMEFFPVDINKASQTELLRVPGVGPTSARRIVIARRTGRLGMAELKKIGVVLKRAQYFIVTADYPLGLRTGKETIVRALIDPGVYSAGREQLSLFGPAPAALAGQELLAAGQGWPAVETESQGAYAAEPGTGAAYGEARRGRVPVAEPPGPGAVAKAKSGQKLPRAGDISSSEQGVTEAVKEAVLCLAQNL